MFIFTAHAQIIEGCGVAAAGQSSRPRRGVVQRKNYGIGSVHLKMAQALSHEDLQKFHKDGYFVLDNFLTAEQCDYLRTRAIEIANKTDFSQHPVVIFGTKNQSRASTDYFITSGDKIRYFFEEGAKGEDGKLALEPNAALNKMGHALHVLDPDFKEATFSNGIKSVAKSLNLKKPCIPQSMVIFKPPKIGSAVKPHQDSTFLYTTPMNLVGFWIALEDADLDNGCMWFAPGSHKSGIVGRVKRRYNNDYVDTFFEGEEPSTKPEEFVAVPTKKGSLVLIHGEVVHKSGANTSDRSRTIFTFHLYDAGTSAWSEENWLQPTEDVKFPFLYE